MDGGSEIPRFQQLRDCFCLFTVDFLVEFVLQIMKFGGGFGSAVSSFLGVVVVRTLYDSNFFLVAISTYFLFIFYPKKLGPRIPCLQIVKKPQLYGSRNTPPNK